MVEELIDGPQRVSGKPYVRPKDAATLLVVRRDGDGIKLLMGRRSQKHKFLPGKFVFPGGKLDLADTRIKPETSLRPEVMEKLLTRMRRGPSAARATGLGLAAIRETFEETGLVLGVPSHTSRLPRTEGWNIFYRTGLRPALHRLSLLARAITPPGRPRRFDARFFVFDASETDLTVVRPDTKTDELLDIHWLAPADTRKQDLPYITGMVVRELEERLQRTAPWSDTSPVPFFYMKDGRFLRDEL